MRAYRFPSMWLVALGLAAFHEEPLSPEASAAAFEALPLRNSVMLISH
jgi:hypothetical protein